MNLAKSPDGRIGRQVPHASEEAVVEVAPMASRRGNVYVSAQKIEDDQAYSDQQEAEQRAHMAGLRLMRAKERRAEIANELEARKKAENHQSLAEINPLNTLLTRYFAKQAATPESVKVANSLSHDAGEAREISRGILQNPADFAADSNKPEIVLANEDKRPISWRADFRQHLMVGNPLTRDGVFGPAVTDWDRFVHGTDVNQEDVVDVAGGTILGRYGGQQMTEKWENKEATAQESEIEATMEKAAKLHSHPALTLWLPTIDVSRPMPKLPLDQVVAPSGMGWEMPSWSDITDWGGGVLDKTVTKLEDQLPDQLAKELQAAILGGGKATTSPTGQITVTRPVAVSSQASSGIPSWALYTGLGLAGLGVLLIAVKALK